MSATSPSRLRKNIAAASFVALGLVGGGVLASTVAANAAGTPAPTTSSSAAADTVDESQSQRSDEQLLTGTDAEKATAAALAKYPGATIQRVETDSGDAAFEAHIVTADGDRLVVLMDEGFAVTGTDAHGGPH